MVLYREGCTERCEDTCLSSLNFLCEWVYQHRTPQGSENCFIYARECPPAITAFSRARLRAYNMHGVQLLFGIGLTLVPVHIIHVSCVALFMKEEQLILRCHIPQGRRPSFYTKEILMNGSRLRVNFCFAGLFLTLRQLSDILQNTIPKPPGLVKLAGKVMNDREQQECIKLEFLPKPPYCENVVSESFFLDDQGFPRVVCVGRSRGQEKVCYLLYKSVSPSPPPYPTHTSPPAVTLVPNRSVLILYHLSQYYSSQWSFYYRSH